MSSYSPPLTPTDGSVTTAKIVDAAVTTAKVADANVTSAKLASGAAVANVGASGITSNELAANAVTDAKIQSGGLSTASIANGAITSAKLASGSALANIGVGGITSNELAANSVTTAKITDANVTSAKLASGAAVSNVGAGGITSNELASSAVTTAKITDANVTAAKLASGAAVSNIGFTPAASGANSDLTSLTGLTSPIRYAATTGITAHAGGGQGSAVLLAAEYNSVDTVASGMDSVLLPVQSTYFLRIVVHNGGAHPLAVYPQSGSTIGSMAANSFDVVPPGVTRVYTTSGTTSWERQPHFRVTDPSVEAARFTDFDESDIVGASSYLNWTIATANSGLKPAQQATVAGHPGLFRFSTNASANGASGMYEGSASILLDSTTYWEIEWAVRLQQLGVTAQQFTAQIGTGDNGTAAGSNGLAFFYDNATNGDIWEIRANKAGVLTKKTTGSIAVAANTWYRLKIIADGTTAAHFFVNDVYVDSIASANLPTTTFGVLSNLIKTNGTTAVTMDVDWVRLYKRFTTAR